MDKKREAARIVAWLVIFSLILVLLFGVARLITSLVAPDTMDVMFIIGAAGGFGYGLGRRYGKE